jgi:hypothetical protein
MPFWHHDATARMLARLKSPVNLVSEVANASDADAYDPDPGPLPNMPYDDVTPDEVDV